MEITDKERALIEEWIAEHQEIEKLEDELYSRTKELRKISNKLYNIKQLSNLKTIVEHDINIENLVEQDIDIEEQGVNIDLKDYNDE